MGKTKRRIETVVQNISIISAITFDAVYTTRTTTERPITVEIGSNEVIGLDCEKLKLLFAAAAKGSWKKSSIPELWDGKASERIVRILTDQAG